MMQPIIIVSGLPRSGTSMMMKMLEAGGIDIYTDNSRKADDDNPRGYFEVERVKNLQQDAAWLHHMKGKAIKVISFLLYYLPLSLRYNVIFMQRDMQEILLSQKKMLTHSGQNAETMTDEEIAQKFERHLKKMREWITARKNIECLYVNYNTLLEDPLPNAQKIQHFLQQPVDVEAMVSVIEPSLYRNRAR